MHDSEIMSMIDMFLVLSTFCICRLKRPSLMWQLPHIYKGYEIISSQVRYHRYDPCRPKVPPDASRDSGLGHVPVCYASASFCHHHYTTASEQRQTNCRYKSFYRQIVHRCRDIPSGQVSRCKLYR
jgi:hypothetical protein